MRKTVRVLVVLLACGCTPRHGVKLKEISHFRTSGWAHDVSLDGDNVYVSDRQGGFSVFGRTRNYLRYRPPLEVRDVISLCPNSGNPLLAARFEGLVLVKPSGEVADRYSNGDIANAVAVRGDFAFAAYGLEGLVVMHLGQGRLQWAATLPTKGWSHDLRLTRSQALLADWDYGLRVVDIRDPQKPAEIGVLQGPATCISLAVKESGLRRMLALAQGHGGVLLADLDSEGRLSPLGRNSLGLDPKDPVHPDAGGWVHSVAWAGRYLFAANWKRGLALLDAGDPRNPRVLLEIPTSGTALGVKTEVQSDGSYLVFLAEGESGLRIFRFRA